MNHTHGTLADDAKGRDELWMQEGLRLYDTDGAIRNACALMGLTRYAYAHEFCLALYRRQPPATFLAASTKDQALPDHAVVKYG